MAARSVEENSVDASGGVLTSTSLTPDAFHAPCRCVDQRPSAETPGTRSLNGHVRSGSLRTSRPYARSPAARGDYGQFGTLFVDVDPKRIANVVKSDRRTTPSAFMSAHPSAAASQSPDGLLNP